jgi:hypothetical protein
VTDLACLDCGATYLRDPSRRIQHLFCPPCSALKDAEKEAFALASKMDGEKRMAEKKVRDRLHDEHRRTGHKRGDVEGCTPCVNRAAENASEPDEARGLRALS